MITTNYRIERHADCTNVSGVRIWDYFEPLDNMMKYQLTEAYLDEEHRICFIYEPHIQTVSGSVDVKLQAIGFKLHEWKQILESTGYHLVYTFILNDYFAQPRYRRVIEYIQDCGAIIEWV